MPAAAAALVLPRIAGYDFETGADLGNASERAQLSRAAIRAFINIARKWKLTEEQSRALFRQIRKHKTAVGSGLRLTRDRGVHVLSFDNGAGNHGAGRVADKAVNSGLSQLSKCRENQRGRQTGNNKAATSYKTDHTTPL